MRGDFKKNVLEIVKSIPKGRIMTYRQVAEAAGYPRACRAVGNVLHNNHDPGIPCHRVIRSDGKLGGYNRGTKRKRDLLEEEGYQAGITKNW